MATSSVTARAEIESHRGRTFAELLIDAEESRAVRTVLVGVLREGSR